jgi:ParB family chromosome partitioning protein
MAKIDRSKNLFDEMKNVLSELGKDSGPEAKDDRLPGRRNSGDEAAQLDVVAEEDAAAVTATPGLALLLNLSEIEPDPEQPRKTFVESVAQGATDNDLESLMSSILQHGVLQPIAVRVVEPGRYRIIAGERRWRASMAALDSGNLCQRRGYDLSRIPAVILDPDSDADRLEMQLVENLARSDMTPVDTAKAVKQLMEYLDPKPSLSDLGKRLGRSKAWAHQMLSLGSEDAQAVAEYLGVPLEAIGQTDISRMKGWMKDEDKRVVLDAIRASLQAGETLSRVLVDREEEQYKNLKTNTDRQETAMQQDLGNVRAFDAAGDEVDASTIDTREVDSDADIDDGGAVDENGVVVGHPGDGEPDNHAQTFAAMPGHVAVTLPRPLLERAFAKAGRELPETMGMAEIVEVLELVLNC